MSTDQAVYTGSVTHTWTTALTSVFSFASISQIEFNAVRLEGITLWQSDFTPLPISGPVFVGVSELVPYCNDYFSGGKRVPVLGGCALAGGLLAIGDLLRPLKLIHYHVDKLRSTNLSFKLFNAAGDELTLPPTFYAAVTITFWQLRNVASRQ